MSVRVVGIDELNVRLDGLSDESKVRQGLNKACIIVERSAREKANAIRDTGALARSITSEVDGTTGRVFTPLEYAPYVEFGTGLFAEEGGRSDTPWSYQDDRGEWHTTSGQHPQPYMRPALQENKQRILEAIREGME